MRLHSWILYENFEDCSPSWLPDGTNRFALPLPGGVLFAQCRGSEPLILSPLCISMHLSHLVYRKKPCVIDGRQERSQYKLFSPHTLDGNPKSEGRSTRTPRGESPAEIRNVDFEIEATHALEKMYADPFPQPQSGLQRLEAGQMRLL